MSSLAKNLEILSLFLIYFDISYAMSRKGNLKIDFKSKIGIKTKFIPIKNIFLKIKSKTKR